MKPLATTINTLKYIKLEHVTTVRKNSKVINNSTTKRNKKVKSVKDELN